jgi:hypothetical protein
MIQNGIKCIYIKFYVYYIYYICVHVYIYVYICIYICIHTYTHILLVVLGFKLRSTHMLGRQDLYPN